MGLFGNNNDTPKVKNSNIAASSAGSNLGKSLSNLKLTYNKLNYKSFSDLMVVNLMKNILQDIVDNLLNLDPLIANSLYGNRASINQYNGLIDLIINNYVYNRKTAYTVERISNTDVIYIPNKSTTPTDINSFYIDFSDNSEVKQLKAIYATMFNTLLHAEATTKIANTPVVKISALRTTEKKDRKFIDEQLELFADTLQKDNGVAYCDALDSVDILDINANQYISMLDMLYSQVCHITGRPISKISGSASGSLNTTGEGDRLQDEQALRGYFNNILKPILVAIAKILGVNTDIKMKSDFLARLVQVLPNLPILEASEIIPQNIKIELLQQALDINFSNNSNNNNAIE